MPIRSLIGAITVSAVFAVTSANSQGLMASEYFPPSYYKAGYKFVEFKERFDFYMQNPLLNRIADDLVFRLITASNSGDSVLRIDFGHHGLSQVTHISQESARCNLDSVSSNSAAIRIDWVKRVFKIDTARLKRLRDLIEKIRNSVKKAKSTDTSPFSNQGARDLAGFLLEAYWPNRGRLTMIQVTPDDVFRKFISQSRGLIKSKAALDPKAVRTRNTVLACP